MILYTIYKAICKTYFKHLGVCPMTNGNARIYKNEKLGIFYKKGYGTFIKSIEITPILIVKTTKKTIKCIQLVSKLTVNGQPRSET